MRPGPQTACWDSRVHFLAARDFLPEAQTLDYIHTILNDANAVCLPAVFHLLLCTCTAGPCGGQCAHHHLRGRAVSNAHNVESSGQVELSRTRQPEVQHTILGLIC